MIWNQKKTKLRAKLYATQLVGLTIVQMFGIDLVGLKEQVSIFLLFQKEKYGAVGALLQSVTPFSIASPHTGLTNANNIPFAAITIEDA